jgi:hypothetical protein
VDQWRHVFSRRTLIGLLRHATFEAVKPTSHLGFFLIGRMMWEDPSKPRRPNEEREREGKKEREREKEKKVERKRGRRYCCSHEKRK